MPDLRLEAVVVVVVAEVAPDAVLVKPLLQHHSVPGQIGALRKENRVEKEHGLDTEKSDRNHEVTPNPYLQQKQRWDAAVGGDAGQFDMIGASAVDSMLGSLHVLAPY